MTPGEEMYAWVKDLFPLNRSITGEGLRQTLKYFKNIVPALDIKEIKSGTNVFDWVVPDEWEISEAFIEDENGVRIIDIESNNLHIIGYSEPVDAWFSLEELNQHLYSLPDQPTAIPYLTSYYTRTWGFCLTHEQRSCLKQGRYHAVIKSRFFKGIMNYGEYYLKGDSDKEILISTYVCHPSMANNELSGPVVATQLIKWLQKKIKLRYSYRFVFLPETIGAIAYLSLGNNYIELKKKVVAGFQFTCMGDDNNYSYLPSRDGRTLADKVALYVLRNYTPAFKCFSYLDRGSDERQWCSPGIDLPVVSVIRTKYYEYPEYHTSLDNLDFISAKGLFGAFENIVRCIEILELNHTYLTTKICEPYLSRHNLYPELSSKNTKSVVKNMMNILSYSDGKMSLLDMAEFFNVDFFVLTDIAVQLQSKGLLKVKMK